MRVILGVREGKAVPAPLMSPICSICRYHNQVIPSFMTYHRVCNKNNMTGDISGAGTAFPSRTPKITLIKNQSQKRKYSVQLIG
jgi:hypothetical protein